MAENPADIAAWQAEKAELTRLISSDAGAPFTQLATAAKWVFTASAATGTIGLATSLSGVIPIAGLGRQAIAIAVLLVGVALLAAGASLTPTFARYHEASSTEVHVALAHARRMFNIKRVLVFVAVVAFALSFLSAASAPLASTRPDLLQRDQVNLAISFDDNGVATLKLAVAGLEAFSPVELTVGRLQDGSSGSSCTAVEPFSQAASLNVDAAGAGSTELTVDRRLLPACVRARFVSTKLGRDEPTASDAYVSFPDGRARELTWSVATAALHDPNVVIGYVGIKKGAITITASGTDLPPGGTLEVTLGPPKPGATTTSCAQAKVNPTRSLVLSDANGLASATIKVTKAKTSLCVIARIAQGGVAPLKIAEVQLLVPTK
jgi:hypothetical protein